MGYAYAEKYLDSKDMPVKTLKGGRYFTFVVDGQPQELDASDECFYLSSSEASNSWG